MANDFFTFRQFTIKQGRSVFKVGTDSVILGSTADVTAAGSILDIGSGTGIIALMLAQRCEAAITAIEPDKGSFTDLAFNVQNSPWAERIKIFNTDLQAFMTQEKFGLVVSNPPYFSNSLRNPEQGKAGARHKDLLTDEDLLKGVDRLIEDEGRFQVIMPKTEGESFIAAAMKYGLFCNQKIRIRSLPSSAVSRLVLSFARKKISFTEKELIISTGQRHQYTRDYIELTKDFYLNF